MRPGLDVGDVDRAAWDYGDRRWCEEATGARAAPLAACGAGADRESLAATGDDIKAEGADERAIGRELAHSAVPGLGDVDVAGRVGGDAQ